MNRLRRKTSLRYATLACALLNCALSQAQPAFPPRSPDFNRIEHVHTVGRMDRERALKHSEKECEPTEAAKLLQLHRKWLTSGLSRYLDCRVQAVPGSRILVWVSEMTEAPQVPDRFSAKDMVFEFASELTEGRITLPDRRVRVFFHNCRHSFANLAGCFSGSEASGYLDYTVADETSGYLDIDVRFYTNERMHEGGIDRAAGSQLSFSFAKRVPVGKPKTERIK
jgi:hypothetical protein